MIAPPRVRFLPERPSTLGAVPAHDGQSWQEDALYEPYQRALNNDMEVDMPTAAKNSFEENWSTITNLMEMVGAGGSTTHPQSAARNRAALAFCITTWESYVEDALREASTYVADNCSAFSTLPKQVQRALVNAVVPQTVPNSKSISGKYPQDLADDGWRVLLKRLANEATEGGNFNTPKTKNVADLFVKWCGLDVTESWFWQNFARPGPANRLDESISLRGEIVHTGTKPDGINKNWIYTYGEKNIKKLVDKTDEALIRHVNGLCAKKATDVDAFGCH